MRRASVAVVGAGSWGTTIASLIGRRASANLWARSPSLAATIAETRQNARYLPGITVPDTVRVTSDIEDAMAEVGLVLVAVPSHGFRAVLEAMAPYVETGMPVVSLAKGLEPGTDVRMTEIIAEIAPRASYGVLTGPNLAQEVAEGRPAAAVVAARDREVARCVQELLHSSSYRVYTSSDVIGCEIAGAAKNVTAIAAGMSDGAGLGENTRAALITRGLAELVRIGMALGADPMTFSGLAGVGDLVATCTSPRSRNRSVGVELGRGRRLADVLLGMRMVAEGVQTAAPLLRLAERHGVEMPIVQQVAAIVSGATSVSKALAALMERPARPEVDERLRTR